MQYFVIYDDSKRPVEHKIQDAIAAYEQRFGTPPNIVLVNRAELVDVPGVRVRAEDYIRPNSYWVGRGG